jgi:hypothetical protein
MTDVFRKWSLFRAAAETGGYVTCDHPVCLNWTQEVKGPPTLASANTSLIFPLSKELCLLGEVGGQAVVADLDSKGVAHVNGALVANADRYVFAADDRFFFLPPRADSPRQGSELLSLIVPVQATPT